MAGLVGVDWSLSLFGIDDPAVQGAAEWLFGQLASAILNTMTCCGMPQQEAIYLGSVRLSWRGIGRSEPRN